MNRLITLVLLFNSYLTCGQVNHNKDTIISFCLMTNTFQLKYPIGWKVEIEKDIAYIIPHTDSIAKSSFYWIQIKPIPGNHHISTTKAAREMIKVIEKYWGEKPLENFQVLKNESMRINKKKFRYVEYQWYQDGQLDWGYRFFKVIDKELIMLYGGRFGMKNKNDKSIVNFWRNLIIKKTCV